MVFRTRRSRPSSSEVASVSDLPAGSAGEEDRFFDDRGGANDPAGTEFAGRFALELDSPAQGR